MHELLLDRKHLEDLIDALVEAHGEESFEDDDDILGVLIKTILSQSTTNANSSRAFAELMERFQGDLQRIADAEIDEIIDAIRVGGLARQKAPRIKEILATIIQERGEPTLEFLKDLSTSQALSYLTSFRGVGPKTARFVLMYAAGFQVFPMDTHIFRILQRVGVLEEGLSDQKAHEKIEAMITSERAYAAHMAMVEHGRKICHARSPDCASCVVRTRCAFGLTQ